MICIHFFRSTASPPSSTSMEEGGERRHTFALLSNKKRALWMCFETHPLLQFSNENAYQ